jgi:hypothetical protein
LGIVVEQGCCTRENRTGNEHIRDGLQIYYDEMPESRNSGIGSEVDFLGNEILRQLHDNS